jgi:glucosyl-3-phosphoglycerate synthase
MVGVRSFDWSDFPVAKLLERKGNSRISVCIPARDEQRTIGPIVSCVRRELIELVPLVDELLVVDDHSIDATGETAAAAGAIVVRAVDSALPGKGAAMARAVAGTSGDVVVFLDGDVENFSARFVTGLVGPLLDDAETMLVKATYERPVNGGPTGGGRVTELVARPLISLFFPALEAIRQPLAGETAVRRSVLDEVVLAAGYGVELALLIDVAERYGSGALAQVDLGERLHRNRPLEQLAPQARDVLAAALARTVVVAR